MDEKLLADIEERAASAGYKTEWFEEKNDATKLVAALYDGDVLLCSLRSIPFESVTDTDGNANIYAARVIQAGLALEAFRQFVAAHESVEDQIKKSDHIQIEKFPIENKEIIDATPDSSNAYMKASLARTDEKCALFFGAIFCCLWIFSGITIAIIALIFCSAIFAFYKNTVELKEMIVVLFTPTKHQDGA